MPANLNPALMDRLKRIKLLLCDVDGILTDASIYVGNAIEVKRFNVRDGLGLACLRESGVKLGWISNRPSTATSTRAVELKIDFVHQTKGSKVAVIETILGQTGLKWDDVCYAGDDIVDLGPLSRAGVAVTVADGVPEAKAIAHYVTRASGGCGAVREIAELILKAQDKWEQVLTKFSC